MNLDGAFTASNHVTILPGTSLSYLLEFNVAI